jgi:hypothetical protein
MLPAVLASSTAAHVRLNRSGGMGTIVFVRGSIVDKEFDTPAARSKQP